MAERKAELLAPAGSLDIAKAVINAGADAVYLGGQMYGARAYAGNLDGGQLLEILQYAHLRGVRIYLTVNTLLKPEESADDLVRFLQPFYEAGLDAVLVQDLGVMRIIRENFPGLPIHVSTQMTVTGAATAKLLLDAGASRIVLARELSLPEIREIYDKTHAELEVFVHGALCYCYSGQCLYSSFRGGRSGNRGRCAQPCRKKYTILTDDGRKVNTPGPFVLSPKDICSLAMLPQILDAGASSLKIEGRMKNVNYAADVTAIYRKYLDLALAGKKYTVDKKDIEELAGLFNRGGFTSGYFTKDKGPDMITFVRPDNVGITALKAVSNSDGRVTFRALVDLHAQDVSEIRRPFTFTGKDEVKAGGTFTVDLPWKLNIRPGQTFPRLKDGAVNRRVEADFVKKQRPVPAAISFEASEGKPAVLTMKRLPDGPQVCVTGDVVNAAESRPAGKEETAARLMKLGRTPFVPESCDVRLDGKLFLPAGQLNAMRREACEKLEKAVYALYSRKNFSENKKHDTITKWQGKSGASRRFSAQVQTAGQLEAVLERPEISRIYLSDRLVTPQTVSEIRKSGREAWVSLVPVVRQKKCGLLEEQIKKAVSCGADGFLVRNLEELAYLKEVKTKLILDSSLYALQDEARQELADLADARESLEFTCPEELTKTELRAVPGMTEREFIAYGRTSLMVTEQCLKKTNGLCDHGYGSLILQDEEGRKMRGVCRCDYCFMTLYDDRPVCLIQEALSAGFTRLRFKFTTETREECAAILQEAAAGRQIPEAAKGHWELGVL